LLGTAATDLRRGGVRYVSFLQFLLSTTMEEMNSGSQLKTLL